MRIDRIQAARLDRQPPMSRKQLVERLKASRSEPNVITRLGRSAIIKFQQMHLPGLRLRYLDAFQQTAQFSDFVKTHDTERLAACAEWLLFSGNDLEVVTLPDELRNVIRQKITKW